MALFQTVPQRKSIPQSHPEIERMLQYSGKGGGKVASIANWREYWGKSYIHLLSKLAEVLSNLRLELRIRLSIFVIIFIDRIFL